MPSSHMLAVLSNAVFSLKRKHAEMVEDTVATIRAIVAPDCVASPSPDHLMSQIAIVMQAYPAACAKLAEKIIQAMDAFICAEQQHTADAAVCEQEAANSSVCSMDDLGPLSPSPHLCSPRVRNMDSPSSPTCTGTSTGTSTRTCTSSDSNTVESL